MIDPICRECGCTDMTHCLHEDGSPCAWMEDDLCTVCADRLAENLARDAARYRYLRNRQTGPVDIEAGGVFAVRAQDSCILGGEYLDRAIDAEMGLDVPQPETLEKRLADCLAAMIDTPLFSGHDETGRPSSALDIRLGFFRPELSERAAELLEEAGQ